MEDTSNYAVSAPEPEVEAPLTLEYFSRRFDLLIRGANRPPPAAVEVVDTMPPGIYVSVHIQGKASSGVEGDERTLRSHGLAILAVKLPTRWRGIIGEATIQALGIAMQIEAIRACGLGDVFDRLFQNENSIRHLQKAASFRRIEQARRVLTTDLSCSLQVLRLEADAMDIFLEGVDALRHASTRADARNREQLLALCDNVESDLGRPWTMQDLARTAGMSKRTLSSRFLAEMGCTAFEFIKERRLLRARDLVADSDASFTTIARLMGFGTSAHFSNAFRKRFGVTAMDFRKNPPR